MLNFFDVNFHIMPTTFLLGFLSVSRFKKSGAGCLLAFTLLGCGGGGGGGGGAELQPAPDVEYVASNLLLSEIAQLPGTVDVEILAAHATLQSERQRCGFGFLTPVDALQEAASGHADWQLQSGLLASTQNDNYLSGWTGFSAADRLVARGYGTVNDQMEAYSIAYEWPVADKAGRGEWAVRELLNAPYVGHRLLAEGYRDLGVAVRTSRDVQSPAISPRVVVDFHLAFRREQGPQWQGSGEVLTYPCEGSVGVRPKLTVFEPSPFGKNGDSEVVPKPLRDITSDPLGTTFFVVTRANSTLINLTATVTKVSTNDQIELSSPITSDNNPDQCCHLANVGFVSANAPLEGETEYEVFWTGVRQYPGEQAMPFEKRFKFTTGKDGEPGA